MSRFSYIVKDANAKTQKGVVEASSKKHAAELLHGKGLYIINIKEATQTSFLKGFSDKKISLSDLVHFTRQLSTMITAGLTLVEALSVLRQQVSRLALLHLVIRIEDEIQGGKSFAEVLQNYPKVFPPIYLALIRAGEASGKLDVILSRLADNLEKSRDLRNKTRGALIYPAIVVTGMIVVSIIVLTIVVPRLTTLYREFDASLPLPTQILISISDLFTKLWWLFLLVFVISLFSFFKWRSTYIGQHVLASMSLKLPIFGNLIKQATLVEVTRTLAILIEGGVPILSSIEIIKEATDNILFQEAFAQAGKMVERGFSLSEPLTNNKIFPPILGQMVAVGEKTGKLGDSLFKLSKYFEAEANNAIRNLTTAIEPFIMVVLGLGVGFLVIAVLMPIYSLTSRF